MGRSGYLELIGRLVLIQGGVEQGVVYSRLHRTSYSISYLW
jgi:hypothetical protein